MGWFAGILLSFRHAPGITGRDRILQFFEPGQLIWALAILLALALLTTGRRFDSGPARKSRLNELVPVGLFVAGAAVMFSALVGVLVELTNFGNGIDEAFAGLIVYLAVCVIGAAETWFAHSRVRRPPGGEQTIVRLGVPMSSSALPGQRPAASATDRRVDLQPAEPGP